MKLITRIRKSSLTFVFLLTSVLFLSTNAQSTTINIAVSSNQFTPAHVMASVGDTVKWNWVDGSHNTTSVTLPPGATSWVAPISSGAPTFNYVITVPGSFTYVCTFHPGMGGAIMASAGGINSYLDENFNYPMGDSLGAHGWVTFSGGAINPLLVTSPGLVYPGYPLSGIGNATTLNISGQDAYKNFSGSDSLTGSFYASFMVNMISAQTGDYFLAFLPNNSTTFYSGRVQARISGTNFNFGITKGASTDVTVWGTQNYSLNTTYLVILKFSFVSGLTNDEVSLFVFPSGIPVTEPAPTIGPSTFPSGDPGNIGRIALRQGTAASSPSLRIDGIRVTRSWSNIVTSINNTQVNGIAENFSLAQNYPNPFNPSTTIKFTIPERGFVNLTIYNSLGKEISNLVNENLEAGIFSSDFDGTGLTSGVYFYKLSYTNQNGSNFIDTKRFVMLK